MSQLVLDAAICQQIDQWVSKYPPGQQRSAVVAALMLVQRQHGGWLSSEAIEAVAVYLDLPVIAVMEVATFYDMFELSPVGRYKISLCTNLSCQLRGADALADCLRARLGIDFGQTTADGQFTLKQAECLAACGEAPMCQVNDQHYYTQLTEHRLLAMIDQMEQGQFDDA